MHIVAQDPETDHTIVGSGLLIAKFDFNLADPEMCVDDLKILTCSHNLGRAQTGGNMLWYKNITAYLGRVGQDQYA